MTQRTRQVEPFDSIKLLIPKPPLQVVNLFKPNRVEGWSFDVKLEAYADVKMYFDGIYGLFDGIAQTVNGATRKVIRDSDQLPWVQKVDDLLKDLYNEGDTILENVDGINTNVNISPFGYEFDLDDQKTAVSDYSIINNKLEADLAYFVSKDTQINSDKRKLIAGEIMRSYDYSTSIGINLEGIQQTKIKTNEIMQQELKSNEETKNRVKQDYDGWLRHIADSQYVSNDNLDISLNTNLLNLDKQTLEYVQNYDIASEYVRTQKTVVNGYVDALETSDYVTLGMQKSDYDQSKEYLNRLKNNIQLAQNTVDNKLLENYEAPSTEVNSTNCTLCDKPEPLLLAQWWWGWSQWNTSASTTRNWWSHETSQLIFCRVKRWQLP
jgi:hypothetical protein